MATTKQYELLFMLKAQMDSAFGTGFTTAKTYVSELQGKINEYKHSLSDISAYQKHQQALTTLNTKLKAEQQALEETRAKIKANGGATKELSKEEETHSDNINKLNEQIAKKKLKEVLSAHNQELLDLIETYLTEREASQRRRAY